MTLEPVALRILITELPMLVEQKSKQTALNNRPEPMSLPINDLFEFLKIRNLGIRETMW